MDENKLDEIADELLEEMRPLILEGIDKHIVKYFKDNWQVASAVKEFTGEQLKALLIRTKEEKEKLLRSDLDEIKTIVRLREIDVEEYIYKTMFQIGRDKIH